MTKDLKEYFGGDYSEKPVKKIERKYGPEKVKDDEFCQSLGFEPYDRNGALNLIKEYFYNQRIYFDTNLFRQTSDRIRKISPKCWFDKEIALEAIKVSGHFLDYAADELKEDLDFITQAIEICKVDAFDYIQEPWISDKKVMLDAIRLDEDCYGRASDELQKDKDVLIALLEQDCEHIGYEVFDNRFDVIEPVVKNNSEVLKAYVAERMDAWLPDEIDEPDKYDSYDAFFDRPGADEINFFIRLLTENGELIKALEKTILTLLPEIILAAIPTFPDAINYAAPPVLKDPDFLLKAYKLKSPKK